MSDNKNIRHNTNRSYNIRQVQTSDHFNHRTSANVWCSTRRTNANVRSTNVRPAQTSEANHVRPIHMSDQYNCQISANARVVQYKRRTSSDVEPVQSTTDQCKRQTGANFRHIYNTRLTDTNTLKAFSDPLNDFNINNDDFTHFYCRKHTGFF